MNFAWASKVLLGGLLLAANGWAAAQSLPVQISASGDDASIVIGASGQSLLGLPPLADVSLSFDDAQSLGPASLGVRAELLSLTDPLLQGRLPDLNLTTLQAALPLLITIEPPANGGLSFRNVGHIEVHTHALQYTPGSSYRLFKAPIGGEFRDITVEIAEGSVRARGSYDGFSQFLIVADLRRTSDVIDTKIAWLRDRIGELSYADGLPFARQLDTVEARVAADDYDGAIEAIDTLAERARARSGISLANEWRATHDTRNEAGALIAGAETLRFSVAYLRDYGE